MNNKKTINLEKEKMNEIIKNEIMQQDDGVFVIATLNSIIKNGVKKTADIMSAVFGYSVKDAKKLCDYSMKLYIKNCARIYGKNDQLEINF